MHFRLTIYLFIPHPDLIQSLRSILDGERYDLHFMQSPDEMHDRIEEDKEKIDCLVVFNQNALFLPFNQLYEEGVLLPTIILGEASEENPTYFYHHAEIRMSEVEIEKIPDSIDRAIAQFLHLGPNCSLADRPSLMYPTDPMENRQSFLFSQQRRLAEKLKERLGYLGVYYKRHPQDFYRNLSPDDRRKLLEQLNNSYREIILNYFSQDYPVNQEIDQFVNQAFFADISISHIIEIHMELIDHFSVQLKLEGRSEEILLDYRLVLIDILAHLGEMYRRSIPREEFPHELLFSLD